MFQLLFAYAPPMQQLFQPAAVAPPLVTALFTLAAGLMADVDLSPLSWAKLIAAREYSQWVP